MTTEENMPVDLGGFLPNDTAQLHIVIPGTNKRTGWVVTMAGPGHAQSIALSNEASRKYLHTQALQEQARVNGRKWKADDKQADDQRREFIESLVGRIVDWTPVCIGSEVIKFTPASATAFLLRPYMGPYISQFTEFLLDDKAFMTDSSND